MVTMSEFMSANKIDPETLNRSLSTELDREDNQNSDINIDLNFGENKFTNEFLKPSDKGTTDLNPILQQRASRLSGSNFHYKLIHSVSSAKTR
jgi:hypothetical protein